MPSDGALPPAAPQLLDRVLESPAPLEPLATLHPLGAAAGGAAAPGDAVDDAVPMEARDSDAAC